LTLAGTMSVPKAFAQPSVLLFLRLVLLLQFLDFASQCLVLFPQGLALRALRGG